MIAIVFVVAAVAGAWHFFDSVATPNPNVKTPPARQGQISATSPTATSNSTAPPKRTATRIRSPVASSVPTDAKISAGSYSIKGGVSAPTIVYKVDPEYSEEAHHGLLVGHGLQLLAPANFFLLGFRVLRT